MKDDDYEAKLERALYELYLKKIGRKESHPLLFKLLRALGFKVRPPHYATPRFVFVFCTLYISAVFAMLLWFVRRGSEGMSSVNIVFLSLTVGAIFGLIMMLISQNRKKQYELTPWEDI